MSGKIVSGEMGSEIIYKLFYAPGSAAMVVQVLLEDAGVDYQLIDVPISKDQPRLKDHLALNPNGWVPVLAWDDQAMYEAAAITVFLTDLYPHAKLGPAFNDPDRPLFLQTLVYFSNTVQTAFQQFYYPERFSAEESDHPQARSRGTQRLHDVWGKVDAQIGGGDWALGDRFSAADLYVHMLTTWLKPDHGHPSLDQIPNVARIARQVESRESIKKVYGL